MNNEKNLTYLIQIMEHFNNNWVSGLASSIWISNKTLKEFMSGKTSKKTILLVESFINQKLWAIINLMDNYKNSISPDTTIWTPHNTQKKYIKHKYDYTNEKGILWVDVVYNHTLKNWKTITAEWTYFAKNVFYIQKGTRFYHYRKLDSLPSKNGHNIKWDMIECLKSNSLKRMPQNGYEFTSDYETTSPTRALSLIRWTSMNWKDLKWWMVKGKNISLNEYLNIKKLK